MYTLLAYWSKTGNLPSLVVLFLLRHFTFLNITTYKAKVIILFSLDVLANFYNVQKHLLDMMHA